jgi:CheY-like chemotaxis protein
MKKLNNGIKILIVEDEEFNRDLYIDTFKEHGFIVDGATNGSEGLEKLASNNDIQIVLMDINMPVMDGLEALRAIKSDTEKYGNPIVIILTSMSSDIKIDESFENSADGYLIKPELLPEEIVKEVQDIYQEKTSRV